MTKHPYETYYIPLLISFVSVVVSFIPTLNVLPTWITITVYVVSGFLLIFAGMLAYRERKSARYFKSGGRGGNATSFGTGNTVIGGNGGNANGGVGGAGGNARVKGSKSVAKGGDGGAG